MKPVLYMAPMQGVTNCVYRNVYSRLFDGYDFAVTPFIKNSKVASTDCKFLRDIFVQRNSADFELIPQILSKSSEDFINLSKLMFEMGYKTVNWNLGCPYKKISRKNQGAGLLSDPETVVKILSEVITAIPNQISLKVRLGNEDSKELSKLLVLINEFPLKNIIIHPRTGSQMYSGEVDISAFEECLSLTKHTVVYNGDINSIETFKQLSNRLPTINNWMIGRGGVINPFLPEQIKNIDSDSDKGKMERFIGFHDEILASYQKELSGDSHIIRKMQEMWSYWSKAFGNGNKILRSISHAKTVNQYGFRIEKFLHNKHELLI